MAGKGAAQGAVLVNVKHAFEGAHVRLARAVEAHDGVVGADAEGHLLAVRVRIVGDVGGYAGTSAKRLLRAACHSCGPYRVPNVDAEAKAVFTNNPTSGAMRGFGTNQAHFAMEGMRHDRKRRFVGFIVATIVLGALFVGGQVIEYVKLLPVDKWAGSTFGASFYTLTGMHGLHALRFPIPPVVVAGVAEAVLG